jgi:hypothetical protein
MEENMTQWRERKKGIDASSTGSQAASSGSAIIGPGEWDEGLGVPLCVVCQGVRHPQKLNVGASLTRADRQNGETGAGSRLERRRI